MKPILYLWSIVLILVFGSGCALPLKKWLNLEKTGAKTEQRIDQNKTQTIEEAKPFVHGTSTALSLDPNPSQFNRVAQDLNKRTGLILGEPSYEEALRMDRIVSGLLSTNEQIRLNSQKLLDSKDKEIISLQDQLKGLEGKLEKIQEEKDILGLKNSQLANTWAKITRWFWIIVWVVVIGICLALISQFLSTVLPPPYSSIFSIVGLIFGFIGRMIFKVIPSSKKFASVVDEKDHNLSEKTLTQIVDAVQTIRHTELKPENTTNITQARKISDLIDPILKDSLDKTEARSKIIQIKSNLGYI